MSLHQHTQLACFLKPSNVNNHHVAEANIKQTCEELLTPRIAAVLARATEPSFHRGTLYTHQWYRVHETVYNPLLEAIQNDELFKTWKRGNPVGKRYHQVYQTITQAQSISHECFHILHETSVNAENDFWDVTSVIKKITHFWILTSCAVSLQTKLSIDQQFLDWALQESALVLDYPPQIDSIIAKLLFHLSYKAQVAEEYQIEFVSFLVQGHGVWYVEPFLKLSFEADYAAAFESDFIPDDEALPKTRITTVRYLIELCCTACVHVVFIVIGFLRFLLGLLSSGFDYRVARERYLAIIADFEAWKDDNILLDNGRFRKVDDIEYGTPILHVSSLLDKDTKRIMASYDRQGMVLYRRKESATTTMNITAKHFWQRYYGSVSSRSHLIGDQLKAVLTRMASIKHTSGGGLVSASALSMIIVWSYITSVITISVTAGTNNWANRDNPLERISDCIWILTTLLISVFGLIKLTSEDPNAIRHALTGKKALLNPRQIYEYLKIPLLDDKLGWRKSLKAVVATYPERIEWLSSYETCYCNTEPIGDIRLSGGLNANILAGFVGLFGKGGIINIVLRKFRKTKEEIGTSWLHVQEEVELIEVDPIPNDFKLGKS